MFTVKNYRFIRIVCLLLLLSATQLSVATAADIGPAALKVSSDPPGAQITIDGQTVKQVTPALIHNLTPGEHRVAVGKSPHYRTEQQIVTLVPGTNTAEFSLMETSPYYMWLCLPSLLTGALMTLFLTIIAVCNGIMIGTLMGVARVIHNKMINLLAGIYVDFIRGTPLLVQIFMIHFGLPPLLGRIFNGGQPLPINPFVSALIALSINSGAYVAEIVRAGIQSIDRGQMEAARSLGMNYPQAMRSVILPQAIKRVIPPLGNEFIAMLKDSSLVSVIGMEELVRKAQIIVTRSYRPTETWLEVGLIFLLMTLPFTRLVAWLERRFKTSD
jgi:glutamine transport system permease protein